MKLSFGRYKGCDIKTLSTAYLSALLEKDKGMREWVAEEIRKELETRETIKTMKDNSNTALVMLTFRDREQRQAFMRWFQNEGWSNLCESSYTYNFSAFEADTKDIESVPIDLKFD